MNDIQSKVFVHSEACTGYFTSYISYPSHCYLALWFHAISYFTYHIYFLHFLFFVLSFYSTLFFLFEENNLTAIAFFYFCSGIRSRVHILTLSNVWIALSYTKWCMKWAILLFSLKLKMLYWGEVTFFSFFFQVKDFLSFFLNFLLFGQPFHVHY